MGWFDDFGSFLDRTFTGSDSSQRTRTRLDAEQGRRDAAAARAAWEQLGRDVPTAEEQRWAGEGEDYSSGALYNPASAAEADPQALEAQRRAMAQLGETYGGYRDIYSQGGLTDADRSRIQQSQMEQKRFERGQSEAAMQQAAARGMLGGGGELLARTQAQQEGANRANAQGLGIEALAQQRAMEALGGMGATSSAQGSLAGSSMEADYRRKRAQDERDEYNNQYRRQVQQRNVDRRNEEQRHNAGLAQTVFGNRTTVAAGKSGQYSEGAAAGERAAAAQREQQARAADRSAGMVSSIIGAYAGSQDDED